MGEMTELALDKKFELGIDSWYFELGRTHGRCL